MNHFKPRAWVHSRVATGILFLLTIVGLVACGGAGSGHGQDRASVSAMTENEALLAEGARLSMLDLDAADRRAQLADQARTTGGATVPKSAYEQGTVVAKAAASLVPVWRFYNGLTGAHFFTRNAAERDHIQSHLSPPYAYEGQAFFVASTASAGLSPVHRFYNTRTGVHFYTISETERRHVAANLPHFAYEGVAYHASMVAGAGLVPFFRFYVAGKDFHFYTASVAERDHIRANLPHLYTYEGIGYYVMSSAWCPENWVNDPGFAPGSGANDAVDALVLQPDGKVLVGGGFGTFGGTARNRLVRLNADGSVDTSFDPGTGANGRVLSMALQSDGKVLVGGSFTAFNGWVRHGLVRLHANGSVDTSFDPGSGAADAFGPAQVNALVVQPDGKVLVGGDFTSFNGQTRSRIARLQSDGGVDASFNPGSGLSGGYVAAMALQPDGRLVVAGWFNSVNGIERRGVARLHADGGVDTGFNPGAGATNATGNDAPVKTVVLQADGKLLLGGTFNFFNGMARERIVRLLADGSTDAGFNPGTGANLWVLAIALQTDGKIVLGGDFSTFNGVARNRLARLNADGTLDACFNPGNGSSSYSGSYVGAMALQSDGNLLIGGEFSAITGVPRSRIARLRP